MNENGYIKDIILSLEQKKFALYRERLKAVQQRYALNKEIAQLTLKINEFEKEIHTNLIEYDQLQ